MPKITDDMNLFDKIMIERLQDACHDFCDDIRVITQGLVEDEREHNWHSLISVVEDLGAALRILGLYGVVDWFPEIPKEMQKLPTPKSTKKKVKPRKKVKK